MGFRYSQPQTRSVGKLTEKVKLPSVKVCVPGRVVPPPAVMAVSEAGKSTLSGKVKEGGGKNWKLSNAPKSPEAANRLWPCSAASTKSSCTACAKLANWPENGSVTLSNW